MLADVGRIYQPKGATAIAMNPNNGDILAMANWPEVDANHVDRAPAWARLNRAVGMTYEPGSTFKAVTVAGALADGVVRPTTQFRVGPQIQVADRVINEAHGTGGVFTVADILARSSNVGAVRIGLRLGPTRFDKWVRTFGFGNFTDLPPQIVNANVMNFAHLVCQRAIPIHLVHHRPPEVTLHGDAFRAAAGNLPRSDRARFRD